MGLAASLGEHSTRRGRGGGFTLRQTACGDGSVGGSEVGCGEEGGDWEDGNLMGGGECGVQNGGVWVSFGGL